MWRQKLCAQKKHYGQVEDGLKKKKNKKKKKKKKKNMKMRVTDY